MVNFNDVPKKYKGIRVLDSINLNIKTGEAVAIIDPSVLKKQH